MQIGVPLIFEKAFLWLYETGLNVGVYRKLLVWIGWENLSRASNPVKKNREALQKLEYQTRQAEFGHLLIFVVVAIFGLVVALLYGIRESFWLFFLNILLNGYPIAERYNRPRMRRVLA